ncbi:MAG: response regulator transcription factor [Candidatus Pseudoruminococcus sp.]|nr:response regulator transcription factor [Ruminococcus sp.]MDY2783674.1 response regulator transcription factor [Candidatus Pseudoruminococcus sp.]
MIIYVVEDDTDIRELESYALKNSGYDIVQFDSGKEVFESCLEKQPSMILLDIMLPDEDGLSILKKLRANDKTKNIPVILVTAKSTELDTVKGLDMGADDYIAKPFGVMELVSRVKALLRRTEKQQQPSDGISYQNINIDDEKHVVTVDKKPTELTFKEYELLKFLIMNKGIVLTREKIMNKVWGFEYEGESRTVDMHIKTLRQKLGESGSVIKTIRNVGYKLGE